MMFTRVSNIPCGLALSTETRYSMRDAEAKTLVDGKKRPIFLFFPVNASRQFVGLAEMVGYVDFNKDLGFWQVDKRCGFFPVEWHVVKDVPNWELCHIILDNNEGKPVTQTRYTHENKLKEGLQMLSIFKKYSAVTSLLDDMDFYEEREKSLRVKEHKPVTLRMDIFKEKDYDEAFHKFIGQPVKIFCSSRTIHRDQCFKVN